VGWIPSVIVATTPGGFASLVGNAYFWTWGTTVFVMETFLCYIHDFRGGVHKALKEKEKEYKRHQEEVLQQSRDHVEGHEMPKTVGWLEQLEEEDEEELDDPQHDDFFGKMSAPPPSSPPRFPSDVEEDEDGSVEREVRLKQTNTSDYFDTYDDILE
jgi:hypothetical protein